MEFNEIIKELEKFKDTEDYNSYVSGLINADGVGKYLETDDGKKYIQPILDKYHSKGLESWKASSLPKILDEEIKKRFPEADPKDTELSKIKHELEAIKQEAARKDLTNKALKVATEKNLPVELIDYFIGDNEDSTNKNLETFEKIFNEKLSIGIDSKLKGSTYVPPAGDSDKAKSDPFIQGLGL